MNVIRRSSITTWVCLMACGLMFQAVGSAHSADLTVISKEWTGSSTFVTQDPLTGDLTIRALVTIGDSEFAPSDRLVLAGLSLGRDIPGDGLRLALVYMGTSGFGSSSRPDWRLRLESASDAFSSDDDWRRDESEEGLRYIELYRSSSLAPAVGDNYRVVLSYAREAGEVSVALIDEPTGEELYSGVLYIESCNDPMYAGFGLTRTGGGQVQDLRWQVHISNGYTRLGDSHALRNLRVWILTQEDDMSLRVSRPLDGRLPGSFNVVLTAPQELAGMNLTTLTSDNLREAGSIPIDLARIAPGTYEAALVYRDGDRDSIINELAFEIEAPFGCSIRFAGDASQAPGTASAGPDELLLGYLDITKKRDLDDQDVTLRLTALDADSQEVLLEESIGDIADGRHEFGFVIGKSVARMIHQLELVIRGSDRLLLSKTWTAEELVGEIVPVCSMGLFLHRDADGIGELAIGRIIRSGSSASSLVPALHGMLRSADALQQDEIMELLYAIDPMAAREVIFEQPTHAEFYVSPTGSDSNPGTNDAPFASIQRARDRVREIAPDMTGNIIVNIDPGDYYLNYTVRFGVDDSGKNGYQVIYRCSGDPGSARFVGGRAVEGWSAYEGNIWRAQVGGGRQIQYLYENGVLAREARYPNLDDGGYPQALANYLISESGSVFHIEYAPGDLDPEGWTITDSARASLWLKGGGCDWGMGVFRVHDISPEDRRIAIVATPEYPPGRNDRYFISGIFELLDAPGEFYYDRETGWLYYYPMNGDPNNQEMMLPTVIDLFSVEGHTVGQCAESITFEGLGFCYGIRTGMFMRHTGDIKVWFSEFAHLGRDAIEMMDDNHHNVVYGCWIHNMGQCGIWIRNTLDRRGYPDNKSEYHVIRNNKIHDYTEYIIVSQQSAAVGLHSASDCQVSHLEAFNGGRYATSLRGHYSTQEFARDDYRHFARGNVFSYIKTESVGTDSGDMGAIHAAHLNPTGDDNINYWRQITVNNVNAHPSMKDYPPNGVFLDHPASCQHQSFENIEIQGVQGQLFRTNRNPSQTMKSVNWLDGFDREQMEYDRIGLEETFPF